MGIKILDSLNNASAIHVKNYLCSPECQKLQFLITEKHLNAENNTMV